MQQPPPHSLQGPPRVTTRRTRRHQPALHGDDMLMVVMHAVRIDRVMVVAGALELPLTSRVVNYFGLKASNITRTEDASCVRRAIGRHNMPHKRK